MTQDQTQGQPADPTRRPFTLYASDERVYASNVRNKLVDLGSIEQVDGRIGYLLDGAGPAGQGFEDVPAALRDMAARLSFLYLDGQFTAQADLREGDPPPLDHADRLDFELDELGPAEPAFDPDV